MRSKERKADGMPLSRMPELDLLRFVAAASVVIYHFTYLPRIHGAVEQGAFGVLPLVTRFGYLGVTLFFMISGFVILWSSEARSPGEFVVSRVARLYPSFWICALLTTLVVNATAGGGGAPISLRTLLVNLTMIPGQLGVPFVDGVYWTLFVELKFYVLVFLVLMSRTMVFVEAWLAVWLAASVAAAVGGAPRLVVSLALYPFGPYFISGCLFYLVRARGSTPFRLGALVVACWLGVISAIAERPSFMAENSSASAIVVASDVVAFHAVFAAIVFRPRVLPASRWWYWLGGLTYPLYLLHNRIGKAIAATLPGSPWIILAVELAVVAGLSIAMAATVERTVCGAFHRWLLQTAIRFRVVRQKRAATTSAASV